MGSIKVAHITTIDTSLYYLLFNQLRSVQRAGYEVVGISSSGPSVPAIEAAGIRHISVPMTRSMAPLLDLVSFGRLFQVLRRERFTIVHTHTPKPALFGQIAARILGTPIIVNTLHGFPFHERTQATWRRFLVFLEKVTARCSDAILSQNPEDIDTAIREGICPPEKVKLLGNGVDLHRFDRNCLDTHALVQVRHNLGLSPAQLVVGFVGRLVAEKGILELFQAVRIVLKHFPSARFLIIGPVDHEKPDALAPKIARKYGVADACIFTGMRQDMPELYALMDVFVLPSHREGFPRSPMEAAAMKIPCVVTDVRGCRQVVEHGRNGLLVPLGDVPALAEAILTLLTDREKVKRMGAEGRTLALKRFDERLVFETVKSEYARLLTEKGLPIPVSLTGAKQGHLYEAS